MADENHDFEHDEAMEWITDWDYERVLSPEDQIIPATKSSFYDGAADDDASMSMNDDEDDAPLPLDRPINIDPRNNSSQEIAIFWTRATEEFTDDYLNGMFDITTAPELDIRRDSRSSLLPGFIMMEDEEDNTYSINAITNANVNVNVNMHNNDNDSNGNGNGNHDNSNSKNNNNSNSKHDNQQPAKEDDDDDSIMGPLQDKEGLLPPMSPSQLYQGNAHYGMMESQKSKFRQIFPNDSIATHTTVDLMDDEQDNEHEDYSDDDYVHEHEHGSENEHSYENFQPTPDSNSIYHRQQQLLQEVLQQAPASAAAIRKRTQLPRPSDHRQRLLQEMKDKRKKPEDPIFARQQEIFHQLRTSTIERHKQQPDCSTSFYSHYSPVSVTRTLTRAGMDSEEYQRVVTRLTEKNLIERQRIMLQESMKRSLETRQALHIKPTALPDYNHDKLSKVLKDIESSSRNISETYGRR